MAAPQPPSGGCVLKRLVLGDCPPFIIQPPSGGCVLKPNYIYTVFSNYI